MHQNVQQAHVIFGFAGPGFVGNVISLAAAATSSSSYNHIEARDDSSTVFSVRGDGLVGTMECATTLQSFLIKSSSISLVEPGLSSSSAPLSCLVCSLSRLSKV